MKRAGAGCRIRTDDLPSIVLDSHGLGALPLSQVCRSSGESHPEVPGNAGGDMEIFTLRLTCGMSGPLVRQDGIGPSFRTRTIPESKPACLICLRVSPEGLERRVKKQLFSCWRAEQDSNLPPAAVLAAVIPQITFRPCASLPAAGRLFSSCDQRLGRPDSHRPSVVRFHPRTGCKGDYTKTAFGPHMITKWNTPWEGEHQRTPGP